MTDMVDRIADILIEDHVELMEENKRLREALEWYEDKVRKGHWGVLHNEYGRKARAALAGKEEAK